MEETGLTCRWRLTFRQACLTIVHSLHTPSRRVLGLWADGGRHAGPVSLSLVTSNIHQASPPKFCLTWHKGAQDGNRQSTPTCDINSFPHDNTPKGTQLWRVCVCALLPFCIPLPSVHLARNVFVRHAAPWDQDDCWSLPRRLSFITLS